MRLARPAITAALAITLALPAASATSPAGAAPSVPSPTRLTVVVPAAASTGVAAGIRVRASGTALATGPVILQVLRAGTTRWSEAARATRTGNAPFTLSWTPVTAGTYQVRAWAPRTSSRAASFSAAGSITVTAASSSITLTAPAVTRWDTPTRITTRVTSSPPAASTGRTVRIEALTGGTWTTVGTGPSNGSAAVYITLARSGVTALRAQLDPRPGLPGATSTTTSINVYPAPTPPSDVAGTVTLTPASLGIQAAPGKSAPSTFGAVRLWDSGVTWRQVETSPGNYNWSVLDARVAAATANGQEVTYVFGSTPSFHAAGPAPGAELYGTGSTMPPADMADFRAFARAVISRYHGRIHTYQAWNESNLGMFWQGTAEQTAQMTAIVKEEVDASDALHGETTQVASASVGVRCHSCFHPFTRDYLAALESRGWPVDVFTAHFYPLYAGGTNDVGALIGEFRRTLADAGAPALPVWNTEVNYRTNPRASDPDLGTPTSAQVRQWVTATYLRSPGWGVDRTYWYMWQGPDFLGVPMDVGTPAYQAATALAALIGTSATLTPCRTTGTVTTCQLDTSSGRRWVAWSTQEGATLNVGAPVASAATLDGTPVTPVGSTWTVGADPVIVTPAA